MICRTARPAWAILALLLYISQPAAAQFGCPADQRPISIGPAYFDAVDGGRALGAVGSASLCRADYDTRPRFPRALYAGFEADGSVPFARLTLPQNLRASGWIGYTVSLTERTEDTGGDLDEAASAFAFNYGVLGVGGRLQYESSTDFGEQALAGGLELRWVNPNWILAPSTVLTLSAVRPLASDVRDALDADSDIHGRLAIQAYWLAPIGSWFEAEIDGRYFIGFGMDELVEAVGLDQGAFLSGALALMLRQAVGPIQLDKLFVGYSHGRQPTDPAERKAWTIGARLSAR